MHRLAISLSKALCQKAFAAYRQVVIEIVGEKCAYGSVDDWYSQVAELERHVAQVQCSNSDGLDLW